MEKLKLPKEEVLFLLRITFLETLIKESENKNYVDSEE